MPGFLRDKEKPNFSIANLSLYEEILALEMILKAETPKKMDGKTAVVEMKDAGHSKWRETEWQGFYFEFKVLPKLIAAYGGGPKKIFRTVFDYSLKRTWDMKVHSMPSSPSKVHGCQLNDAGSIDEAVRQTGFGLILLNGIPDLDLEFTRWHKKFRGNGDVEPRRMLKKSFIPKSIDIFFIPDEKRLEKAKENRELIYFRQGKQPTGEARNVKYSLDAKRALESDLHKLRIEIN